MHRQVQIVSLCPHMQKETFDANTQQWMRQVQPLHKRSERSRTFQRLCTRPRIRHSGPVSDYERGESSPHPQDSKPVSPHDRRLMQATAMPKKKQGQGGKFQTVRLQGGGTARMSPAQPPTDTGIGDYARRMKEAGVFDAVDAESYSMKRHKNCCTEALLILTFTAQRGRTVSI